MLADYLDIRSEVAEAIRTGKPVVALESTIISHGMPYPRNAETALNVERIVRERGAIPATIAIVGGKLKVGLAPEEIETFGKLGTAIHKASRRDIPFLVARQLNGATTVASTMIIAVLAGIRVFATGGIGGVHRGATETFDISADLQELAHTNVAVVCAGAKAILDIGLTLEYLESNGVPVIGYQTEEMPAFYTRESGFKVDYRVDSPAEVALALKCKWDLGLTGGVIIANPIPAEYAMDPEIISGAISRAIAESVDQGVKGKDITPFLLDRIQQMTGGDSLDSNIQLVYNNARLGAEIAVELARLAQPIATRGVAA
jgi:pseudouridine-5'-phosphate glycosidase